MMPAFGWLTRAALGVFCALAAACSVQAKAAPTPMTMAAIPVDRLKGRGARVSFVEYEAENGRTNGVQIGPDRTFGALPAEASGRRAVRLSKRGDYVEFVLARPADALSVRYAIPDTADGRGLDATLGLVVAGWRIGTLELTSRFSWLYGDYPFTNRPADGRGHHAFAEARLRLGRTLPAGTAVRIEVGPEDHAPWYVLDLADFEIAGAPKRVPAGALSAVRFGADPTGRADSSEAIQSTVDAARRQKRPAWLPAGVYRVTRHIEVDQVELAGAGAWWTVLTGPGVGVFGRTDGGQSRAVRLRDFAIIGEVNERNDRARLAAIGGAIGGGSEIQDLWLQRTKGGLWVDGPVEGLVVRRLRIVDQTADGLNFHGAISDAVATDLFVRGAGDDGLAMWSGGGVNRNNAFRNNTVIASTLANGIALYGGRDIEVSRNLVADSVTEGGGYHLGARFKAAPFSGRILLASNLAVRSGVLDRNWRTGVGALWLYALDRPINADIEVRDLELVDSTCEAIQFRGEAITGVNLRDVRIRGAGTHALQLEAPGSARFSNMVADGLGAAGVGLCRPGFEILDGGGNVGWGERGACVAQAPE
jgi:hypothetical protein